MKYIIHFLLIILTLTGCKQIDLDIKPKNISESFPTQDCSQLCSDNPIYAVGDNGYSYLSFENFGRGGVGKCRGHALLTQKMSILATFKKSGGCRLSNEKCIESIKKGIRKIMKYQTYTFKGFANLFELSSVPEIERFLRIIVASTPHRYRAGSANIRNNYYLTIEANVFHELVQRIYEGHLPYIGINGYRTGAHAVLGYEVARIDGRKVICARDPNYKQVGLEQCVNYFYLDKEGVVYFKRATYDDAEVMFTFKITSDEDKRITKYNAALKNKCMSSYRKNNSCI